MKNISIRVSAVLFLFILLTTGQLMGQELKDIDGNSYKTVKHGVQVWTARNLNVSHFSNGDPIPEAATEEEWKKAGEEGKPAWCYYNNDPANGAGYGRIYNWYAINDPRGLAPKGWHIPDNDDWRLLVKNLLGIDMAGINLRSTSGWKSKPGKNTIGFTAVPGGYREPDGSFKGIRTSCRWWSNSVPSEVKPSGQIYSIALEDSSFGLKYEKSNKNSGFYVRCEED